MPTRRVLGLVLAALVLAAPTTAPAQSATVFQHANLIPMDRERTLLDQMVVVRDGQITAIGRDLPIPAGSQVIDARGQWLSPGLADMHVHSETPDELAVYVAHGVTTVLAMGGAKQRLVGKTAPRANRGEIVAPHVYTSLLVDGTPDYNGFVLKTPAQARALPAMARAQGYDFIKVYVGLTPPVYEALATAARAERTPLVGHGVYAVRIDRQLAAGQVMIAHLEEFFYSCLFPPDQGGGEGVPPDASIADAVALAKRFDATITADPLTYRTIAELASHPSWGRRSLPDPSSRCCPPNGASNGGPATILQRPPSSFLEPTSSGAWSRRSPMAECG